MRFIELTQNKQAVVDDEDYEYLNQWKWHYSHGYAVRAEIVNNKQIKIYLHRFILGNPVKSEVDHINNNKLDDRKSNLRKASRTQNTTNKTLQSNNTSGYKGVSFDKHSNKWHSYIRTDGYRINLGRFENIKDAAIEYDKKAKELFGEYAKLNFPEGEYYAS